jgi:hypothetical protein
MKKSADGWEIMWLKLDFHSDQQEIPNKVPLFMRVAVVPLLAVAACG